MLFFETLCFSIIELNDFLMKSNEQTNSYLMYELFNDEQTMTDRLL